MGDAPIRYTRGPSSVELSWARYIAFKLAHLSTWGYRRTKPVFYHPIALAGITLFVWSYIISPWITANLMFAVVAWRYALPDHYRSHVQPRIDSFWAGFRY